MNVCFCRSLLAAAIVLIAIFAWGASWAKIAIIAAAAVLILMSLAYKTCCCAKARGGEATQASPPSSPTAPG